MTSSSPSCVRSSAAPGHTRASGIARCAKVATDKLAVVSSPSATNQCAPVEDRFERRERGESVSYRAVEPTVGQPSSLDMHRFARPAARVSECAHAQGKFDDMRRVLFGKQDSPGLTSWSSYAIEARMPDLPGFEACVAEVAPVARIEEAVKLGERVGVMVGVPVTPSLRARARSRATRSRTASDERHSTNVAGLAIPAKPARRPHSLGGERPAMHTTTWLPPSLKCAAPA